MYQWTVIQDRGNDQHLATVETSAGPFTRAFPGAGPTAREEAAEWAASVARFEEAADMLGLQDGVEHVATSRVA